MSKYLGIDSSTQSITGLIIDAEQRAIVAEASINFDEYFKATYGVVNGVLDLGAGAVHSAPLMWAEALDLLLQTLADQGHDLGAVRAVGGSGQQHGTVYLNASAGPALARLSPSQPLKDQLAAIFARPTAPIWMDTSTAAQCAEIEAGVGGRASLLALTGNAAFERFSGPQIRKFYQTEPAAYADTAYIGLVSSYVASLLAGRLVGVDPGDGSGTNMMDIAARQWSVRALDATAPNLANKLLPIPPLASPSAPSALITWVVTALPTTALCCPFRATIRVASSASASSLRAKSPSAWALRTPFSPAWTSRALPQPARVRSSPHPTALITWP